MSSSTGHPYREAPLLPSARLVAPPQHARRVALALAVSFVVFAGFALLAPWQQSVRGTGRVTAYAPLERRQDLEAPVAGRVVRWFVEEGQSVREGDPIVEIADNDPLYMERLAIRREATVAQLESATGEVDAVRERMLAVERAQASAVRAAEARAGVAREALEAARQRERAEDASLDTAMLNLARQRALSEEGLASTRQLELAILDEQRARTARDAARASVGAAIAELAGRQADLERARADAEGARASAQQSLQSAIGDQASGRESLAELESTIARQEAQRVLAPRAGTILRLAARQGGEQVRAGDVLATLVPDTESRAIELWVDGNDAALVEPGRAVRVQLEGWPAVQFTGWPSVAVGTFGGRVAFVDSTDDGRGDFRVVVVPDPDDEPWPDGRFLRQGNRANGWVLLRRVTVGFELWRQFNGFPPAFETPPSSGSSSSGSYSGGTSSSGSSSGGYGAGR